MGRREYERRSSTAKYSAKRPFLELVLFQYNNQPQPLHEINLTHVTITTPLALTQANKTCPGFAPIRFPIVAKTGSTGPPGVFVIGLYMIQKDWNPSRLVNEEEPTYVKLLYASVIIPCVAA